MNISGQVTIWICNMASLLNCQMLVQMFFGSPLQITTHTYSFTARLLYAMVKVFGWVQVIGNHLQCHCRIHGVIEIGGLLSIILDLQMRSYLKCSMMKMYRYNTFVKQVYPICHLDGNYLVIAPILEQWLQKYLATLVAN